MKKKMKELGIGLLILFPILLLDSCHSSNPQTTENRKKTDTVFIQQMQFTPATLTISKGDTVIWINKGMVDHTVKEAKTNGFYSDTIHVGKSWIFAPKENAEYFCSIHPTMKGKIVIK